MNHPHTRAPGNWLMRFAGLFPDLRLLAGLLLAYLALMCLAQGNVALAAAAGGAALLCAWWRAREFSYHVVGPLFWHEIVRLARSGWAFWLRFLYGLTLLLALWLTYEQWQVNPGRGFGAFSEVDAAQPIYSSRLALAFSTTLFFVQNVVAILLTALYLGGSIIDERQSGTMDYLFATHLYDHEIILGKLCARLVMVGSVLLVGLPVLALMHLLGGVSLYTTAGSFVALLGAMILSGSVTIFFAAACRSRIVSIYGSQHLYWLFTIWPFFGYLSSPFFFNSELQFRLLNGQIRDGSALDWLATHPSRVGHALVTFEMSCSFLLAQLLVAVFFLRFAVQILRSPDAEVVRPHEPIGSARPLNKKIAATETERSTETASRRWRMPAIFQHPLWQRETSPSKSAMAELLVSVGVVWLLILIIYCASLLLVSVALPNELFFLTAAGFNAFLRGMTVIVAASACAAAGFQSATTIGPERKKGILDSLLMLPDTRWTIFSIKSLAVLWKSSWLLFSLVLFWLISVPTAILHPLAALLLLLAVIVHLVFFVSLGMWLSLICRTTMQATVSMGCVMMGLYIVPWLFMSGALRLWSNAICPLTTWWTLGFPGSAPGLGLTEEQSTEVSLALFGILGYALAGAIFWLSAQVQFHLDPFRRR